MKNNVVTTDRAALWVEEDADGADQRERGRNGLYCSDLRLPSTHRFSNERRLSPLKSKLPVDDTTVR